MRLTALVDVGLGAEGAAQLAVVLGVVALVGEHGADARHDREGGEEQPLEDEGVVDLGRGGGSHASITVAMRCKRRKSNVAVPVWYPRHGQPQRKPGAQPNSTESSCGNRLLRGSS